MHFNYLLKLTKKAKTLLLFGAILLTQLVHAQSPGNALQFDGANDYLALPNGVVSTFNGDYTIESWFLLNNTNNWQRVFDFGNSTNNYAFFSPTSGAGSLPRFAIRTASITEQLITGTSVLQTGRWHHVAITYSAATTTATMYINGLQVGQNTVTTLKLSDLGVTTQNWLGRSQFNDPYLNGSIDEFRIWNVQKSAAEIQASMYNTVANSATGLFAYYNFDIGTAGGNNAGLTTLPDLTSNANNGTLMNTFSLTGATSNWIESYAMVAPTPIAATSTSATGFTANWTAPAIGIAESYFLEVSSTSNFSAPIAGSPFTIVAPTTSQVIAGLTAGTNYYYRLRANKSSVNLQGAYSTVYTTTTFSTNANLAGLTISTGTLSPDFSAATIAYTTGVFDLVNSTTITPTANQANATIQVQVNGGGFTTVISGNASNALPLIAGNNTIDIQVTAQDGITTKNYTITVTKSAAANADLASLSVSVGSLTPMFSSAVLNYANSVSNVTTSLTVTPTTASINAIIKVRINGGVYTTLNSGDASTALNLNLGNNTVDVQVTAEDGTTIKLYSILVYRDALLMHLDATNVSSYSGTGINWNDLSGLNNHSVLTNGPTFSSYNRGTIVFDGANDYAVVNSNANILSTTAYTKIAWINPTSLSASNNIISGGAANGFGQHAFWMAGSNRLHAGHNGAWSTVVSNTTFTTNKWYCVAVTYNNTSGWKLYINGVEEATSSATGSFSGLGNMFIGSFDGGSVFAGRIAVAQVYNAALSAQDILSNYNSVKERYLSDADLTALSLSSGTLSPVFASNTLAYSATTNNASITLTPTSSAVNALIQVRINGAAYSTVNSENASNALALNIGNNTIDVNVTAQDGTTIKTYTITVTRAASTNANLSSLLTSVGSLNPAFDVATTAYTVNVNNATSAITVTPTVQDVTATVEVKVNNGSYVPVTSGNASGSLALSIASNTVYVKVTAQNGTTSKVYILTVIRAYSTPPTITDFSPKSGTIGSSVIITGTNFNTTDINNIVYFGATKATVTNATATSLTVTVPVGASYQNISVTDSLTSLSAYTNMPFTVTYTSGIIGFGVTRNFEQVLYQASVIALGDLDGDSKVDMVTSGSSTIHNSGIYPQLIVQRNVSTPGVLTSSSFVTSYVSANGLSIGNISIGDLDGDGKPDLAMTSGWSSEVTVLKNTSTVGNLSFAAPKIFHAGNNASKVHFADLDSDGKPEMVLISDFKLTILKNTSTQGVIDSSSFAPKVDFETDNNLFLYEQKLAIGDIDGDGKIDVVVSGDEGINVFRNTSTIGEINSSSFAPKIDFYYDVSSCADVALFDLDGDGKLDITVSGNRGVNTYYEGISVLRNISTVGSINSNSFSTPVNFRTSNYPEPGSLSIADLDGDGKPDIAVKSNKGIVSILKNTSTFGIINTSSLARAAEFPVKYGFAIADLDGDSKADIAAAGEGYAIGAVSKNITLMHNQPCFIWQGTTNNIWSTASNWNLNAVPTGTDYVVIPSLFTFPPTIIGTHAIDTMAIAPSTTVTVLDTLQIKGKVAFSGFESTYIGGNINASAGTIEFNGTQTQEMTLLETEMFRAIGGGSKRFNNLIINNPTSVDLTTNGLEITGTLSVLTGNFNAFGIVLKSFARVAPVLGSLTGHFGVDRYIPAGKRSFRFLTPGVNAEFFSIKNNWQSISPGGFGSTGGWGTHITGSVTGANGFDATLTGNPSMFLFNNATQTWGAISNTDVNGLKGGLGYRLFIRGDRNVNLNAPMATNTATTLRTYGEIVAGNVTFGSLASAPSFLPTLAVNESEFSFVGNPYVSSIDWSTLGRTGLTGYYYIWDPTLGTRGAYVSCFTDGTKSNASSDVTTAIQTGQAFFVQNTSSPSTRELNITEADKTTGITNVFRTQNANSKLDIQLFLTANSVIDSTSQDGALILFNTAFDNTVNDDDAAKFANQDENIAIQRGNHLMSIERRNIPFNPKDTIFLKLWQTTQSNYRFKIDASNFGSNLTAFLVDNYLQTETALSLSGISNIHFSINSNAASQQVNRFSIVFKSTNVLPVTITSVNAFAKSTGIQVEWNTINEINMLKYEVEKSINGIAFEKVGSVQANHLFAYNWYDANAVKGNNYYRIKALDKNGTHQYTQIVLVKMGTLQNSITVLGNPIKNRKVVLQFQQVEQGKYQVTIVNNLGQQVTASTINYTGGNGIITIPLENLIAGTYQLKITNGNAINETKTIVVE